VTPSQRRGEYVLDVSNETLNIMRSLGIEPPRRRAPLEQARGQQATSAVFRPPPRPSSNHFEVCPECGSKRLVHREDCVTCLDCGWSACVVT
ncbi:MAG: hypothetical protein QI223_06400, partial [Candidatus Korarchaeota archaeon]|nr:hypothetical protein [Candidatus Korarchaeota archaeon]